MRDPVSPKRQWIDTAAVVGRLVLGGLFLFMGLKKALHPADFLILIREYNIVHTPFLLNSIAAALPWFETFCGLLLLAGVAVRGTAVMLVAMLIPFSLLVLRRALEIAQVKKQAFCLVKFDCGCGAGEVFICNKLLENSVLILLSIWLIAGFGRKLAIRYSLFEENSKRPSDSPISGEVPQSVSSVSSHPNPK